MTLDDNALLSYEVLWSALRYVGHSPTSGSWQNQGWRATSHQVSKMNQVKPSTSVENTDINKYSTKRKNLKVYRLM
jgi:hypothetical protein